MRERIKSWIQSNVERKISKNEAKKKIQKQLKTSATSLAMKNKNYVEKKQQQQQ